MTAHEFRVFADFSDHAKESIGSVGVISESDAHHLLKVLRLGSGDEIVVVSRTSQKEYYCTIAREDAHSVTIIALKPTTTSAPVVKSLIVAVLKGPKNDLICEQAGELGVGRIIFWQATRSVIRIDSSAAKKREARLSKIAESAARQSGQNRICEISFAQSLKEALEMAKLNILPDDSLLCCCFSPEAKLIRELAIARHCHIIIGPESDFAPLELNIAFEHGFQPISLGPLRLRSETAAVCAIASAQGLWGKLERC